jgi:uncharacterized membrane protein YcaP (DUF421 family)
MDLQQMLIGDFSWLVIFEIVIRTVLMYLFTLGLLRLLGKRGVGHLSPFELVIIVALGSAVGDPMIYPEVPLIHGLVVLVVVVALQRLLEELTRRGGAVEALLESTPTLLIHEGEIDEDALERENLSEAELFTALREQGVQHLGQVKLAYLEPSGRVTVFKATMARPGRSVLPD